MTSTFQKIAPVFIWALCLHASGAEPEVLFNDGSPGDFKLADKSGATVLAYDPSEAKVVQIATEALAGDIKQVTGQTVAVQTQPPVSADRAVFIGTVGKSALIDGLVQSGKLDAAALTGKWESYLIATVDNPRPGLRQALVIAGSDRRGTAYGVFTLSQAVGVSPWHWWDDVPAQHHDVVTIKAGAYAQNSPAVKYRGIFLNDEDWSLQPWAAKNMDPEIKDIGPKTYARICELLLRLKANLLWPAMHPCTKAFNIYPENKQVADDYAIVMGSSHCEPMLRDNVTEWDKKTRGEWNYQTNRDQVRQYWEERVAQNGKLENVYTLGMRGIHDDPFPAKGTMADKVALLEQIFTDQRDILSRLVNPDLSQVPQIFIPYKEVLKIYQSGLVVPDDVALMWVDDNFGYIRELSNPEEEKRAGGSGVYYHVSYWGGPHDYLWLGTTPPALIWEEMTKAYDYNARKVWVLNVGGFKKSEIETDFFLHLAWDVDGARSFQQKEWLTDWAARQFGPEHSAAIGEILDEYYRLNDAPKPEHFGTPNTIFSVENYNEAEKRLASFARLIEKTDALYAQMPEEQKDAFFELVLYPVHGSGFMNEKFIYAAMGDQPHAQAAYDQIQADTETYNLKIAGGKWNLIVSAAPRKQPVFDPPKIAAAATPPTTPLDDSTASPSTATAAPFVFTEREGVVAMEAQHFTRSTDRAPFRWQIIDGLGRTGEAITVLPATGPSFDKAEDLAGQAPELEYDFVNVTAGPVKAMVSCLPTHAVYPGRGLRYAIAIDDETPQFVSIDADSEDKKGPWSGNVLRGAAIGMSSHTVGAPGRHTLKIWSADPGLVVDKIVLDLGGLKTSFFGPPETR
jgi:hypothetical protein